MAGELRKSSRIYIKALKWIRLIYSTSPHNLQLSTRGGKTDEICDLQQKNVTFEQPREWVLIDAKIDMNIVGGLTLRSSGLDHPIQTM
jgi:hypothetical protein